MNRLKIQLGCLLFILFTLHAVASFACKCPAMAPLTIVECRKFDVIAQCRIDSVGSCNGKASAYVSNLKLFKGEVDQHWVLQFDCSTSCQLALEKGESWLFYAKYNAAHDLELGFCDRNRKMFANESDDYFTVNTGMSFKEEIDYLIKNIGLKQEQANNSGKKGIDITQRENDQTSGSNKIWLLLASLVFFLIFYYFVQKRIS